MITAGCLANGKVSALEGWLMAPSKAKADVEAAERTAKMTAEVKRRLMVSLQQMSEDMETEDASTHRNSSARLGDARSSQQLVYAPPRLVARQLAAAATSSIV